MGFNIEAYQQRSARLEIDDVDFTAFSEQPLGEEALRCLRYMHDIESHTVCYLRDVLVTRSHRDPEITTFLTLWNYEEHWHGEAIARILDAHGEPSGSRRIASLRRQLPRRDQLRPLGFQLASALTPHLSSIQMTWGALNEWTTQAAYASLAERSGHPVLGEILRRIMRQEGRHIDFYASQAKRRLDLSRAAQRMTRWALARCWEPVGSGVAPPQEVAFMATYLFGDDRGMKLAQRIDRRVDALPGLGDLHLMERAIKAA